MKSYFKMVGGPVFSGTEHALTGFDMKVRPASRAVGDSPALNLRKHAAQYWIIVANYHHPIKRNAIHEVQKCALHIAHVAIAVHVLAIDICDHGQNGRKLEKGTVALIGLGHQIL